MPAPRYLQERPIDFVCVCGNIVEPTFLPWKNLWCEINSCPLCVKRAQEDARRAEIIHAVESMQANLDGLLLSCGASRKHLSARLTDFPETMRDVHRGPALCLIGPPGTGKTYILTAIMAQMILDDLRYARENVVQPRAHHSLRFITLNELLWSIRRSFNGGEDTESTLIDRYTGCHCLFLDDVGHEKPSDWAVQTFFLILDRRYRDEKKTYFSSNLSLGQLAEIWGAWAASRISEMTVVKKISGQDRRLQRLPGAQIAITAMEDKTK